MTDAAKVCPSDAPVPSSDETGSGYVYLGPPVEKGVWISVDEREPPWIEPVVYCRRSEEPGRWFVGIAYRTDRVGGWRPAMRSKISPYYGWTHWMPLPEYPRVPPGAGSTEAE